MMKSTAPHQPQNVNKADGHMPEMTLKGAQISDSQPGAEWNLYRILSGIAPLPSEPAEVQGVDREWCGLVIAAQDLAGLHPDPIEAAAVLGNRVHSEHVDSSARMAMARALGQVDLPAGVLFSLAATFMRDDSDREQGLYQLGEQSLQAAKLRGTELRDSDPDGDVRRAASELCSAPETAASASSPFSREAFERARAAAPVLAAALRSTSPELTLERLHRLRGLGLGRPAQAAVAASLLSPAEGFDKVRVEAFDWLIETAPRVAHLYAEVLQRAKDAELAARAKLLLNA